MKKLWSVEVGLSSRGTQWHVPHFFACSSYRPRRLYGPFVQGTSHVRCTCDSCENRPSVVTMDGLIIGLHVGLIAAYLCRGDITSVVDWVLKIKSLSICVIIAADNEILLFILHIKWKGITLYETLIVWHLTWEGCKLRSQSVSLGQIVGRLPRTVGPCLETQYGASRE